MRELSISLNYSIPLAFICTVLVPLGNAQRRPHRIVPNKLKTIY